MQNIKERKPTLREEFYGHSHSCDACTLKIFAKLKQKSADDIIVVAGGVTPDEDVIALNEVGVSKAMLQDTLSENLVKERGPR